MLSRLSFCEVISLRSRPNGGLEGDDPAPFHSRRDRRSQIHALRDRTQLIHQHYFSLGWDASCARRARPQWTIQVYTQPRAWPFSTWAVLAIMWHPAPVGSPTGTAEEIAGDLYAWPARQDFP